MKIAYIYFGQVKNFNEKQFNSFNENVYKYIDSHDVDFHLVTSKNLKYSNPRQQESEDEENDIYYQSIKKYFNFKNIFYDELDSIDCSEIKNLSKELVDKFGGAWGKDSKISTENSLKQIYSLEFFYNQFSKLDKNYDLYIFSRSDLFHTHPIDISEFSNDYDILVPYYDNLPQIDYGWFGGVNDRFAVIKNKEAMKSYCCRYSRLKKSPEFYHAEKYLMKCIQRDNLKLGKIKNFELRFVRSNGKITDQIGIYPSTAMNIQLKNISKSYFINLDRRTDRLNHMLTNLPFFAERFSAIDSECTELNEEIKILFPETWAKRSKAEICCALSHYKLWKKLSEDPDARNYLILEDDTVFKSGFEKFWNNTYSNKFDENAWITYLGGCQPWNKNKYNEVLEKHNDLFYRVKKNDYFIKDDHFWHMNANSYVISKKAALFLCKYCEQIGMDEALDIFMIKIINKIDYKKILHINPLMTHQLHEENGNIEIDKNSDIRHSEKKFFEKNTDKMSIIIPTVWAANDYTIKSLLTLEKENAVDEIIVVNNNKQHTPHWINAFSKVRIVDFGRRMYFNESINFAIDLCRNDICCIYNDDITCDPRIFNYILNNIHEQHGCIFISPKYINTKNRSEGNLIPVNDIMKHGLHHGSGMLMFLRKKDFIKIPEELVHHFGDTFIFQINKKQNKQNYIVEGFPIQTPGSLSEDDQVRSVIQKDWQMHKKVFSNLSKYLDKKKSKAPFVKNISDKYIPKQIHLSWVDKKILDSNCELIKKGVKKLQTLNPDWDIEVSDDEDINKFIRDNIGKTSWELIKNKKMTEKTDLWRLLKIYKEGGLYIDIDRYIDVPMSEILKEKTVCVIPTFQDIDFSQDFILSHKKSIILEKAISNNLFNRKNGHNLFYIATISYMHAVSEFLTGKKVNRGHNPDYFNLVRNKLKKSDFFETYREIGPEHHTLFRNINKQFNLQTFEKEKAEFYNKASVTHWNIDTQKKHNEIKYAQKKDKSQVAIDKIVFTQKNLFEEDFLLELFGDMNVVYDTEMNKLHENACIVYSDLSAKNLIFYQEKDRKTILQQRKRQEEYFKNLENRNCCLVHLSDEHRHAEISHYKYFEHVFRQYYRQDAVADNVTFIPLGYKKGFRNE